MMSVGCEQIFLWLEEPKYAALVRELKSHGEDVEAVMQAKLNELYEQTVPVQERIEIDDLMEADRLADIREAAAARRFSAFRIVEKNHWDFFETEKPLDFPQTASHLRRYLRGKYPPDQSLAETFTRAEYLDFDSFDCRITEFMDGREQIQGVFEIDLDRQLFSTLDREQGWQEYNLKDVSAAIYHARRKEHRSESEVGRIFYERLGARELLRTVGSAVSLYVAQLPAEAKVRLRAEVESTLKASGEDTAENIERAMNGKLTDLDGLIDIQKYMAPEAAEPITPGSGPQLGR